MPHPNRGGATRSLAIAVLAIAVSPACAAAEGSVERSPDGTATVKGVVIENVKRCVVDGTCYARVRAGEATVRIVYNPGEGTPCANEPAQRAGIRLEPGQRVVARGNLVGASPEPVLDTCPDPAFFIKPSDGPAPSAPYVSRSKEKGGTR
jgi:hypothetical protein